MLKGRDRTVAARAAEYRRDFGSYTTSVVTGNRDHYERIRGLGYDLSLDNWRA